MLHENTGTPNSKERIPKPPTQARKLKRWTSDSSQFLKVKFTQVRK